MGGAFHQPTIDEHQALFQQLLGVRTRQPPDGGDEGVQPLGCHHDLGRLRGLGKLRRCLADLTMHRGASHRHQIVADIRGDLLQAEQISHPVYDLDVPQKLPLDAQTHQRAQTIPVPQLPRELFVCRGNGDTLHRTFGRVAHVLLPAEAGHPPFGSIIASHPLKGTGQLARHFLQHILLSQGQKLGIGVPPPAVSPGSQLGIPLLQLSNLLFHDGALPLFFVILSEAKNLPSQKKIPRYPRNNRRCSCQI